MGFSISRIEFESSDANRLPGTDVSLRLMGTPYEASDVVVSVMGRTVSILERVADCSCRAEIANVSLIESSETRRVFVLGGEHAYWISGEGECLQQLPGVREWDLQEFWSLEIHSRASHVCVILETVVLILDSALSVHHRHEKFINDTFLRLSDQELVLQRDDETEYSISLA